MSLNSESPQFAASTLTMRSEALPSHNSVLSAVLVAPDIAFSTASRM